MASKEATKKPTCVIVLGMAGSGKTTFVQRLVSHLHTKKIKDPEKNKAPYVVNLDPACHEVPYPANVDIRDTVNYKEVMKQYKLGPNGGIITSLNLFATKFDQVLNLVERRSDTVDHVIFDTPGKHIEAFSTLVESLVQMTCIDFTIFLKLAQLQLFSYGKQWKVHYLC